jgi:glutamyl-tRNA reductase
MSDFKILHRLVAGQEKSQEPGMNPSDAQVWKTCLREVYFSDSHDSTNQNPDNLNFLTPADRSMEVYKGVDAEAFLAEVLSGLKSQMVGETEVFGQFKNWWNQLPNNDGFKQRNKTRIDRVFNLVKQVREKALSGHGSQSYGSLIRKNLNPRQRVDVIGSGHLTEEILPWLQKQQQVRLWCRNREKVCSRFNLNPSQVLEMMDSGDVADVLIVAAPLNHQELNEWLSAHGFSNKNILFDLRADSSSFQVLLKPLQHKTLQDFFSEFAATKSEIEKKAQEARQMIQDWKSSQLNKYQVRPYGWDDL